MDESFHRKIIATPSRFVRVADASGDAPEREFPSRRTAARGAPRNNEAGRGAVHRWETQPPEEGGRRTGTVLVVDDDGNLRRLARTVLAGEGYAVLEAADGPGALDAA